MQPKKKVKTNANDIKPLITDDGPKTKKPVKTATADNAEPQEEEKQIQIKTTQLQRNKEVKI
jgi:hypothetical protein